MNIALALNTINSYIKGQSGANIATFIDVVVTENRLIGIQTMSEVDSSTSGFSLANKKLVKFISTPK